MLFVDEFENTVDGYELFGIYCKLLPVRLWRLYITVIFKPLNVAKVICFSI
ncbi:hypothetical protein Bca4012_071255 [Brassica carinata]